MDARAPAFALAGAVFLADRASKWIIQDQVSPWQTVTVIPGFFNIVHTRNPGAAFSLLAAADPGWRTLVLLGLSLAAVVLVTLLLWRSPGAGRSLRWPLALILGGALGNLYDRLLHGQVTDFLEFYLGRFRWPAFNLADGAITVGALLVALDLWRSPERAGSR